MKSTPTIQAASRCRSTFKTAVLTALVSFVLWSAPGAAQNRAANDNYQRQQQQAANDNFQRQQREQQQRQQQQQQQAQEQQRRQQMQLQQQQQQQMQAQRAQAQAAQAQTQARQSAQNAQQQRNAQQAQQSAQQQRNNLQAQQNTQQQLVRSREEQRRQQDQQRLAFQKSQQDRLRLQQGQQATANAAKAQAAAAFQAKRIKEAARPPTPGEIQKGFTGRTTADGRALVRYKDRVLVVPASRISGLSARLANEKRASEVKRSAQEQQVILNRIRNIAPANDNRRNEATVSTRANERIASVQAQQSAENADVRSNRGRTGKQARLRELATDDKLGSADRGWIKQEINSIDRGQRPTIRNPPGKDLAHERGREAAKGYSYEHSNLQDRKLHRLQHKYDNNGQLNVERTVPSKDTQ